MLGIVGIVGSLALLIYLAYRGINVLFLAPVCAVLAVIVAGSTPLLATYTQVFMVELGKYLAKFFPIFMLGAIFGKLMDDSGSARVIAEWIAAKVGVDRALLAIVLACAVLTYGGVSLFVVAFAVYPVGIALLKAGGLPKRLLPGAIALGSFTLTMTALPGTPAIQNAIPGPFFGTTPFAAPGLGVVASLIMFLGGMLWLNRRAAAAKARGEGYGQHIEAASPAATMDNPPVFIVAVLPIIAVITLNYLFSKIIFPGIDTDFLAEARYGSTKLSAVNAIWSIISAVLGASVLCVGLNWRRFANIVDSLNKGTFGSMLPIFNTASEVGYGSVIASLPAFALVRDGLALVTTNPVIGVFIAVNVLAGITGSASGGLSIALQAMSQQFIAEAQADAISMELLARVASMSSGGFDALPHNGAVITLLGICGLTHRDSYFDIFIVACIVPVLATIAVMAIGLTFGTF